MSDSRHIDVAVMTRVEGEGALDLRIKENEITELRLRIFEPPRLFEKFLEGRDYHEVPDIVARICGICPVAYQMSAVQAIESVFGVQITPWIRNQRRLLYCGEWIQSHSLHVHLLAAPDFLGFENSIAMAEKYPDEVRRGLKLQGLGNRLMRFCAGRSVHPIGVCVGGFYHAPSKQDADELLNDISASLQDAKDLIAMCASLPLPDDPQYFTSVALRHADEYGMYEGRLVSTDGLNIPINEYQQHFKEFQVPHSTSLHASLHGHNYLVGPLARINLNRSQLPSEVQQALDATGIQFPSNNMFHSIVARAAELYFALLEAQHLLAQYEFTTQPAIEITPKAGVGYGCTEAPRGILWHRYELNDQGQVINAIITPPTSQNQARIEEDIHRSLMHYGLDHSDDELRLRSEMVVRNYDPCISCSTHFLNLNVKRS